MNKMPLIYCCICIEIKTIYGIKNILCDFENLGIKNVLYKKTKKGDVYIFQIAVINYSSFWYLNEALKMMFEKIPQLYKLKKMVKTLNGTIWIDIAYYHYKTHPALVISGINMKKIKFLDANISIDPY